jgi:hypothetical protein
MNAASRRGNLKLSNVLFIACFNFCRVHNSLGTTPAQAAGLTDRIWTIKKFVPLASFNNFGIQPDRVLHGWHHCCFTGKN